MTDDPKVLAADSINTAAVVGAIVTAINEVPGFYLAVDRFHTNAVDLICLEALRERGHLFGFSDRFEPPADWQVAVSASEFAEGNPEVLPRFFDRFDQALQTEPFTLQFIDPDRFKEAVAGVTSAYELGTLVVDLEIVLPRLDFCTPADDSIQLNYLLNEATLAHCWEAGVLPQVEDTGARVEQSSKSEAETS